MASNGPCYKTTAANMGYIFTVVFESNKLWGACISYKAPAFYVYLRKILVWLLPFKGGPATSV